MLQRNCSWKEESIDANFIAVLFEEITTATPNFSNHHSGRSDGKESACNEGDLGLISG